MGKAVCGRFKVDLRSLGSGAAVAVSAGPCGVLRHSFLGLRVPAGSRRQMSIVSGARRVQRDAVSWRCGGGKVMGGTIWTETSGGLCASKSQER